MKNGKVLYRVFPCMFSCLMLFCNLSPVYAVTDTQVQGTIQASTIDISATGTANYTIKGKTLTSDTIGIINNSNFPIELGVAKVEKVSGSLEDVLPETVGKSKDAWFRLGKNETKSKIALGLKKISGEYIKTDKPDTLYFREVLSSDGIIHLGAIASKDTVAYNLDGYYGLAFDSNVNEKYKITWSVELFGKEKVTPEKVINDFTDIVVLGNIGNGVTYDYTVLTRNGKIDEKLSKYNNKETRIKGTVRIDNIQVNNNPTSYIIPNYLYDSSTKAYYKIVEYGDYSMNLGNYIRALTIPNGIEKIGASNLGVSYLNYVVIPDSVNSINTSSFRVTNNSYGFQYVFYNGLPEGSKWGDSTAIVLPYDDEAKEFFSVFSPSFTYNSYTKKVKINLYLKEDSIKQNGITDITIPNEFKGMSVYMGSYMFAENSTIEKVIIEDGITSFPNSDIFKNATKLKEIYIPDSITYIDSGTFKGCSSITTIVYSGEAEGAPWGATNATVLK